jgi:hypothetical protein
MRSPFSTPDTEHYLEPGRSPLIPLSCLLAIAVAVAVTGAELGGRFAIVTGAFALIALATRVPRVLPVLAVVTLGVAAFSVHFGGQSLPTLAAHVQHAVTAAHRHGVAK